jgi:hypothetical protein
VVCSLTSFCSASRALLRMARRSSFSLFGSSSAFPRGFTILLPATILFDPTIKATGMIEHTWDVGIPALSSSLASVAPQRVLVPQVEVKMAPDTP